MKRLVFILACIVHFLPALAQNNVLLPAKEGKKWGYINPRGEWIILPKYDRCLPFDNRLYTSVSKDGQTILINRDGQVLYELGANQIIAIEGDYLIFQKLGLQGVMHKTGRIVINADYQTVEYAGSGNFLVHTPDGYGMADSTGTCIIEPTWLRLETMFGIMGTFFKVSDSLHVGLYNSSGTLVIPAVYVSIHFDEDYIKCTDLKDKIYIYDKDGRLIISGKYAGIKLIHKDYLVIERDEGDILFHIPSQTKVDSTRWKYAAFNASFLITQTRSGKVGLMSVKDLRLVIPEDYDYIRTLSGSSLLILGTGFTLGLSDTFGNLLTGNSYTEIARPGVGGTLTTKQGIYYGLLAPSGKEILPPVYERLDVSEDQTIKAKRGTNLVLYEYSNSFRLIDSLVFTNVSTLNLGGQITMQFAAAQGNTGATLSARWFKNGDGKYGLKDNTGAVAIPAHFDNVVKIPNSDFALGIIRKTAETMRSISIHIGADKLLTLVNEKKSRVYGKPNLAYIDTAMLRVDSCMVVRCIAQTGYACLIYTKTGETRNFNSRYIGAFREGIARVYIGGNLYMEQTKNLKVTGLFPALSYINEFDLKILRVSNSRSLIGNLTISGPGFWAYIDHQGNFIRSYDFFRDEQLNAATDYKNGRAVVRSGHFYGLLNKSGNYVLHPEYASITFLPNCGDSLLKTVTYKSRYGFISADGGINIPPTFSYVNSFSDGFAWVHADESTILINKEGKQITSFQGFHRTTEFNNGVSSIKSGYRFAIIDSSGTLLTPYHFSRAYSASEGYIPVRYKGYVGYLREDGSVAINPQFSKGEHFVNGLALVQEGKKTSGIHHFLKWNQHPKYGYINYKGEFVIAPAFNKAWTFDEHGFAVVQNNRGYGLINTRGQFILKPKYKKIFRGEHFYVGQQAFSVDLYNRSGKKVKSFKGKNHGGFQNGLLVIRSGKSFGAVDSNGNWVLKPKYNKLFPFEQGFTACQKGNLCYIISSSGDTTGTVIGRARDGFHNGMLLVRNGNQLFYVNHFGENVFGMGFTMAEPFEHGMAIVKTDSAFGVLDSSGFYFIYPEYAGIERCADNVFIVRKLANIGVCNLDGINLITPKCEDVRYEPSADLFCYSYRNQLGYFNRNGKIIFEIPD